MALDDNEQRILEEIEKQFYDEDPTLARAVRRIEHPPRMGPRLSVVGMIAGLAIIIAYVNILGVAIGGFALLVFSATSFVSSWKLKDWSSESDESAEEALD